MWIQVRLGCLSSAVLTSAAQLSGADIALLSPTQSFRFDLGVCEQSHTVAKNYGCSLSFVVRLLSYL